MTGEKVDRRLNLKGEVCPYPTAKTSMIPIIYGYSLGVGSDR